MDIAHRVGILAAMARHQALASAQRGSQDAAADI